MGKCALSLGLVLLVLLGCQRGDDYLHHVVQPKPEVFNFTHKLKELQGENRVDILMVIDNSGSMGSHQQNVIRNADQFMQEFTKNQNILDWRMGLISTDVREKPYIGFEVGNFLDKNTANPVSAFSAAVNRLGTNGDATEKPWGALQKVLLDNPAWSRKGAILALIVITDAPDQSQLSSRDFISFLSQVKSNPLQLVGYGVYGATDWNCPNSGESLRYVGSVYEEFALTIKGKNYPLCAADFGNNLADLGQDLVKRVKAPRIALTMRPQIETIRVRHKDKFLKGGPKSDDGIWQYDFDLNAIVFHDLGFAPDDNEEVIISYEEAVKARTH